MWPIVGAPDGSFYFDNQPNMLDQFLVNKNIATARRPDQGRPSHGANPQTAGHDQSGHLPKPLPFGGMGKPVNQNGFSDHFPVTMTVTEAD